MLTFYSQLSSNSLCGGKNENNNSQVGEHSAVGDSLVHGGRGGGGGPCPRPQALSVFHKGPVLVVKVHDLGGLRQVDVEAVVAELVAGLAAEAVDDSLVRFFGFWIGIGTYLHIFQ